MALSAIWIYSPEGRRRAKEAGPVAPIPYLNHQFGRSNIFDSGTNRGIAMEISGFIRLERPGTYAFQANSNDGFRLYIDGQRLIDDPDWHADRLSPEAQLPSRNPAGIPCVPVISSARAPRPFSFTGSPPAKDAFSIVPAKMLAHQQPY